MTCEEFEVLGMESDAGAELPEVRAHLNACPRCAALQESWQAARLELQMLRRATQDVQTPLRVEMRLRQAFRMQRRTTKTKQAAFIGAWALAAAAVLLGAIYWHNWRDPLKSQDNAVLSAQGTNPAGATDMNDAAQATQTASGEFTPLPGSMPQETDNASVVRVRLQRGALGALGLPVNAETAGEWIQVDLLIGEDGQPQAVRLPKSGGTL